MGTPPTSEAELRDALAILAQHNGNFTHAAAAVGMSRSAFTDRIRKAEAQQHKFAKDEAIELPDFIHGDDEEPIDELLARLQKAHHRKKKEIEARTWFPIKIGENKPYALMFFGDVHLGVNCDWDLLHEHIAIARQDGVYCGSIGDHTDNFPWTGKMARLWADVDISSKTERRLANWFLFETGIKFLVFLLGNHDQWNGYAEFYKMLGAHYVPVIDWRAQFALVHNNGTKVRVDAAHGRKGSSIYNPTHGTLRDAKFGENADLYVSGHIHSFGLFEIEFSEKKQRTWLAQVSGYKIGGLYETTNGFAQSNYGASVFAIIYPDTGRVQCFSDPKEGAGYLKFLRNKA